jgi:alkylation response protein AidB-like acyl-CoA dehydrogenase
VGIATAEACRRATEACYLLAGGSAVYLDSPLQRRLRDMMVLAQHVMVQERQYAGFGAFLLNEGAAVEAMLRAAEPVGAEPARLSA